MGVERADRVVALQGLLLTGVRDYGTGDAVARCSTRMLATAASLDYVLMLATGTAGVRIAERDASHAIAEGFARGVDDALALLRAILDDDHDFGTDFVRDQVPALRAAIQAEDLASDDRTFALIALASDVS
jgi:hypothetical protein